MNVSFPKIVLEWKCPIIRTLDLLCNVLAPSGACLKHHSHLLKYDLWVFQDLTLYLTAHIALMNFITIHKSTWGLTRYRSILHFASPQAVRRSIHHGCDPNNHAHDKGEFWGWRKHDWESKYKRFGSFYIRCFWGQNILRGYFQPNHGSHFHSFKRPCLIRNQPIWKRWVVSMPWI